MGWDGMGWDGMGWDGMDRCISCEAGGGGGGGGVFGECRVLSLPISPLFSLQTNRRTSNERRYGDSTRGGTPPPPSVVEGPIALRAAAMFCVRGGCAITPRPRRLYVMEIPRAQE
jgi:hypothetical protein